ncbi:MAG: hypothetical protein WD572_02175 [Gammaproteobacteria bacterium]
MRANVFSPYQTQNKHTPLKPERRSTLDEKIRLTGQLLLACGFMLLTTALLLFLPTL